MTRRVNVAEEPAGLVRIALPAVLEAAVALGGGEPETIELCHRRSCRLAVVAAEHGPIVARSVHLRRGAAPGTDLVGGKLQDDAHSLCARSCRWRLLGGRLRG